MAWNYEKRYGENSKRETKNTYKNNFRPVHAFNCLIREDKIKQSKMI
jgi:hypothetical protein